MSEEIWHVTCGDTYGKQLCEGRAYQIEIKGLKARLEQSRKSFESLFAANKVQVGMIDQLEETVKRLSKRGIEDMKYIIEYQDSLIDALQIVLTDVKNTNSDIEDNCVAKINEINTYKLYKGLKE
jgi:hypothetical protein